MVDILIILTKYGNLRMIKEINEKIGDRAFISEVFESMVMNNRLDMIKWMCETFKSEKDINGFLRVCPDDPSIVKMALNNNQFETANWLISQGFKCGKEKTIKVN